MSIFVDEKHKTIMVNALKAQAVADAMGEQFEFQRHPRYQELSDLILSDSPLRITDDTQMTLFGLEAMSLGGTTEQVKAAYLRWYRTQAFSKPREHFGLGSKPEMYSVRAPGNTCLSALRSIMVGMEVRNDSKGCGTVMRNLPFLFDSTPARAVECAKLTHKHAEIVDATQYYWLYAKTLMQGTIPGEHRGVPLGEVYGDGGWTAMPCLQIGIWAFENCGGDYRKLLALSILHGGDSDSTAAVAGALFGMYYGFTENRLFDRLVEAKVITEFLEVL